MIRHGGEFVVSSGGVADATVIGRGGLELVMSGGVASGAIVDRGGTLEFAAADTGITQDIRFSDAGWGAAVVKFDAAATTSGGLIYDGVISGFDSPDDEIDLAGLGFVSGQTTATSVLSGSNTILTITNGAHTVALTLAGDRTSDSFAVSSDGSGGTTVTDTTPGEDLPLGWLDNHVAAVVSDLYDFDSGGFSHLVDWIEGRHSSDPGPTPPSDHPPCDSFGRFSGAGIRCRMAGSFGAGHGFVRRQHRRSLPAKPDSAARPSLAEHAAPGGETRVNLYP